MFVRRASFSWMMLLFVAVAAHAASPALTGVLPRGGQRGTDVQVTFAGDRLADAQEIFLYNPGITVKDVKVVDAKQVKATLAIAPDAPLGEHALRVRTATGISELRTFWVGPLPVVAEAEPNNDPGKPQKITLNSTVEGVIKNEDLDYFAIDLKKGQRVTAEVEGMRLGGGADGPAAFDPYVAILSAADGKELAAADDSALHLQDPVTSLVVPADGSYVVLVRDSAYAGNDQSHYRVHVGTFPRPRAVYPAGGQAGQELSAELIGDPAGAIKQTIKLPAEPTAAHPVVAEQDGQVSPSPNLIRVSPFPNTNELEPNNDVKSATAAKEIPVAFNGIIGEAGDTDWFRFTAKKDQQLDIRVFARRLRSPLDPTLAVGDSTGKASASDDDNAGTPDSYLRFPVPADGEYTIWIADHLKVGGADHVYRIEVTPAAPKLTAIVPPVGPNSQERQAIVVPRGNRFASMFRVSRADIGGAVKIDFANLPKGVAAQNTTIADGHDVVPVVFEAAADAPVAGALATVTPRPADEKTKAAGAFEQKADLVVGRNQTPFYQATVDKLAVAVAEEAPFKLSIVEPKVPIVQSGAMQLKVAVERKEGFTAPITIVMPWAPPGVSAGGGTIAEKATEGTIPLNASGDAAVNKWKVCVLGTADAGGPVWVSTQLAELEVAPSILGGKIEMAAGERGKPVQVLCKIEPKKPFEGKAKLALLGLPPNTAAEPKEISAADTEVIFDVTTNDKSPTGQHKSLFCQLTVTQSGEPIQQTLAGGGVIRIDAPAPPKPNATPVAAATPADAKPAKPLSRLEKLRLEQAAQQGAKQ
jgi:hypothetical protein